MPTTSVVGVGASHGLPSAHSADAYAVAAGSSPTPTTEAPAGPRGVRAAPPHDPHPCSLRQTVLSSALRNRRKRLTKQAASAARGASHAPSSPTATAALLGPCSGFGLIGLSLDRGGAWRRRLVAHQPYRSRQLVLGAGRSDLRVRLARRAAPATSVWSPLARRPSHGLTAPGFGTARWRGPFMAPPSTQAAEVLSDVPTGKHAGGDNNCSVVCNCKQVQHSQSSIRLQL